MGFPSTSLEALVLESGRHEHTANTANESRQTRNDLKLLELLLTVIRDIINPHFPLYSRSLIGVWVEHSVSSRRSLKFE